MLELDSPRWATFVPEGGEPRAVPDLIRRLAKAPGEDDWIEAWDLIAPQWTLARSAYAAVPHLVRLLDEQGRLAHCDSLAGLARCACPREREADCPEDLRAEFDQALAKAGAAAARRAKDRGVPADDYLCILCSAAALSGKEKLGRLALSAAFCSEDQIPVACPQCGEYLTVVFANRGSKVFLRLEDLERSRATSPVVPAEAAKANDGDVAWGLALAQAAGQKDAVAWLCGLAGGGECPMCRSAIVPLDNVCYDEIGGEGAGD